MAFAMQNNARRNLRLKYSSALHFTQSIDVQVSGQDHEIFQAQTKNFSAHGLQILCSNNLRKGQRLKLFLNLAPYGIIPVDAVVEWTKVETAEDGSPYWLQCGLSIDYNKNTDVKKTIFSYLKECFLRAKSDLSNYELR